MNDMNVQRNYKDTIFRMLFKEKENLLSLYNALKAQPERRTLRLSDAFEEAQSGKGMQSGLEVCGKNGIKRSG